MIKNKTIFGLAFILVLTFIFISFANALVVMDGVSQDKIYPGQEGNIELTLKNTFNEKITDVSVTLIFSSTDAIKSITPVFNPYGSSTDTKDEIADDDTEHFSFNIKAINSAAPGDYVLGYVVTYTYNETTITDPIKTFGATINSQNALDYSISQQTMVQNMKDKVTFTIYNKGDAEVKFVIVQATAEGATLLSDSKSYIGNIASDDSQTANYNILINNANPSMNFIVTYKDFENNDVTENVNLDLTAYSRDKALKLGLITQSKAPIYFGIIILVIVVFFIVRAIRKARAKKEKLKNSSMK